MPYKSSGRLPSESASKLGHLAVTKSEWVKSLISDFESIEQSESDYSNTEWQEFVSEGIVDPLKSVWATDGSYVSIKTGSKPSKEVSFVKTALLTVDRNRLDAIDKEHPHPLLLQDIMSDSAVLHATVFPLKNVRTKLGSNYDAIRHIVNDSMKIDQNGAFFETLKWLSYKKWSIHKSNSPAFKCPCCGEEINSGFPYDVEEWNCPIVGCGKQLFLTDMIGFHLDMDEDSAPDSVVSSYMLIMEHLMLFTAIRLLWEHTDPKVLSNTLFIKDGPLTLRSQYSKFVPLIREFLQHAKESDRPVHIIGQEKKGAFVDHLESIARFPKPHSHDENLSYSVLTHNYVRREVYRTPDLANPYGNRTNWGEKLYVKLDPATHFVLSVPTGAYDKSGDFPSANDLIGLDRILDTLESLVSRKFEGALFPIELANGIASMSSYPSATILQRFAENSG